MIIINNEEALRISCEEVKEEEISALISTLENELNHANRLGNRGIGLAAPQIGIGKHVSIVRLGNDMNFNLVNAKLEKGYDQTIFRQEGCLSFPSRVEDTMRYQEVVISNDVYPHKFIATGLLAVAIQHELDHLNSILFMDRKVIRATTVVNKAKMKPNELCHCGSNIKYKRCHGK